MKTIEEMQQEIDRLTIAYENASEQRIHYVKKCLELSEVVLNMDKCIGTIFLNCDHLSQDALEAFRDNKRKCQHVINQLKRNIYLEVKK